MATRYATHVSTRKTSQREAIPGSNQVQNSAGGFSFAVTDMTRLERFLILGNEGGSYYASERKMTKENAGAILRLLKTDGLAVVRKIVEISDAGRAPKNDPAIFALALAAKLGDDATRKAALTALPQVCRIGTHLFAFADTIEQLGGWSRGVRNAVTRWYTERDVDSLAYQVVKYQQRDGRSHRDMLRLAHLYVPDASSHNLRALLEYVRKGETNEIFLPKIIEGTERIKGVTQAKDAAALILEYGLPREVVPTEFLTSSEVWAALLQDMPMTAMIRNLATMTRVGLLVPGSVETRQVQDALSDSDRLRKSRVHPIQILIAQRTYAAGHGMRGSNTWAPVGKITDALNDAFYGTFQNVVPSGKRFLLALDVSGSMAMREVAGVPNFTPRDASAAMALVTAATEDAYSIVGFTSSRGGWSDNTALTPLNITPRQRLQDAIETISGLPFGGTDCALPMLYASKKGLEVDTFVVYTDSETWAGNIHPVQALRQYRKETGIPAKLVVVGMVSNGFSIADPDDAGMLDVVGFDTAAPAVISDFARG